MDQNTLMIALVVVILAWFGFSRYQKSKNGAVIAAAIAEGAVVVDVRTAGEYGGHHYYGAINIPVDTLAIKLSKVGAKDKPVVVYCASGGRSAAAAGILRRAGFSRVVNGGGLSNMPPRK